ncbi:hypothetical protein SDIMI_v3c04050 [Spiroplasma diminutum CUAS-1]|uniref:Uncharacterized protein n=2 Tax=Spiroplasma diminutum TaxID=216936 RepID=S5LWE7_9MOLU|nr:hypothetical protein SDIMI_v3c04050 [Spiroplasma diminutum CUAS-1]
MINFLATITLTSSTTLSVISCGNTKPTISFYETDYNTAFNKVFENKNNTKNENFSMLPDLDHVTIPPKEIDEEIETPKTKSQFELSEAGIKLNCTDFNCQENNTFTGIGLTNKEYNEIKDPFKERMKAQYAIDDLASWFSIQPNENEGYLYDFSNLSFYVDYSRNNYFFNKYENKDELILWSKENYIEIKHPDRNINSEFTFFDKKNELDSEWIKELLNSSDVSIEDDSNKLNIEFALTNESEIKVIIKKVNNLFSKYQSNLDFKESEVEIEKQEGETLPPIESEKDKIIIFESTNLNKFIIEKKLINQISIKFTIKSETGGESNEKNTLHII